MVKEIKELIYFATLLSGVTIFVFAAIVFWLQDASGLKALFALGMLAIGAGAVIVGGLGYIGTLFSKN